ncbi:MAG: TauD/TfdA family dioxygenase [Acidobacteriota bacterium]
MLSVGPWKAISLAPFGMAVEASPRGRLAEIDASELRDAIREHRVVVLRGFPSPDGEGLPAFAARLGKLQSWDFGVVNELFRHEAPRNYLYTNRAVPLHWDGAFAKSVPRFICFHCVLAPPSGGETIFSDTVRVAAAADGDALARWRRIRITYTTERIAHYGGSFTSPVVSRHPDTGVEVLRFAEPVEDLNPVSLSIQGLHGPEHAFVEKMRAALHAPFACLRHAWRPGDLVLADNHALLHGRAAYDAGAPRHLRRVNVL